MSCNGCRVLRKGCSDTCILRHCLHGIDSPEAQAHATVFLAKFFGRAGLMGLITAVPENQRPALFQSLLYEACGRTVNPVHGAVGLLWTGQWSTCQAAVEAVLKGEAISRPSTSLGNAKLGVMSGGNTQLTKAQSRSQNPQTPQNVFALTVPATSYPPDCSVCSEVSSLPERSDVQSKRCRSVEDDHQVLTVVGVAASSTKRNKLENMACKEQYCATNDSQIRYQIPYKEPVSLKGKNLIMDINYQSQRNTPDSMMMTLHALIPKQDRAPMSAVPREGQLVAPVPRRIRPPGVGDIKEGKCTGHQSMGGNAPEALELDLTLNTCHSLSSTRSPNKAAPPFLSRVSSPSSISINSEGSVTSLGLSSSEGDQNSLPACFWSSFPAQSKVNHLTTVKL